MLLSHETGIPIEGSSKALRSLSEAGFAHYDEANEVVFVPNMARQQIADKLLASDKQQHGVMAILKEYRKSKFVADFVAIYRKDYNLPDGLVDQGPSMAHPRPFEGPSKPRARTESKNREQEQEQEGKPPLPKPGCKCIGGTCIQPNLCKQSAIDAIAKASIAEIMKPAKIRPRTPYDLETCMRAAMHREQPQVCPWVPGRFSTSDADKLFRDLGDIEAALPVIERKIEIFAKDKSMQPWTMAKFIDKWNEIGLEKLEFGKAPAPKPVSRCTPVKEW
jgi:hypothetical protein